MKNHLSNNHINIKHRQFLISKRPIPYTIVLLFSVQSHCDICEEVEKDLQLISASYKEEFAQPSTRTPVFFAIMHYDQRTRKIFERVNKCLFKYK